MFSFQKICYKLSSKHVKNDLTINEKLLLKLVKKNFYNLATYNIQEQTFSKTNQKHFLVTFLKNKIGMEYIYFFNFTKNANEKYSIIHFCGVF